MKLTDINNVILGNVELPKNPRFQNYPDLTDEIKDAIVKCEGLYNKEHFTQTMSHTEFYEANPLMDAFLSDYRKIDSRMFKKELFYTMLCETYIPSIPSELTAMLVLTRRKCETPNKMIAALDKSKLKKYVTQQIHENPKIIKEVIDKIWGYEVNLVTSIRRMVTNNGVVEIYIDNINDILLCNPSIRDILSDVDDVQNLWYSKDKGIVIGDNEIPLRTVINSFGIVKNDLDLRRVFSADET